MKSICKKALAVLMAAVLIGGASPAVLRLAVTAVAEPVVGTCGAAGNNLTWSLDTDTGALTVSGTGDMADFDDENNSPPWADYIGSISSVVIENGVTSIGDMAFFLCRSLTDVTIGTDVARIGNQAFTLSSIAEVYVPRSVREIGFVAFGGLQFTESGEIIPIIRRIDVDPANETYSSKDGVLYNKTQTTLVEYPGGSAVTAFTVPDGVTEIAGMAFAYAMYLQDITLPDSLTTIGSMAFNYCASLGSVAIPGNVTTIGEETFLGCFSLENVSFGEGITEIPESLLAQCENLRTVTLADTVAVIGAHAFAGCKNLVNLTLDRGVRTIGQNAFYGCESLAEITIPSGVTEIGSHAFSSCTSMTDLTFNAAECADMDNVFVGSNVQTLVIGSGVTKIPAGAFVGLERVTAVTIPDSVTEIGAQAFLSCGSLADVTIGSGVGTIGTSAFQNCTALPDIHIPSGVTAIGSGAFENCTSLAYICSEAESAYAKRYAEENNIEFRLCGGHGGAVEPNTVSGECGAQGDNVTWTLNLDTNEMTISGSGDMADYISDVPWRSYIASVHTAVVENGVTRIGENALRGAGNLTSVTLGESVRAIGDSAFEGCSALTSVTFDGNLTAIGANAFKDAGLSAVSLPSAVREIGTDAFLCGVKSESGAFTPTLTEIAVDGDNAVFSAQDGVLYNKAETVLILYPAAHPRDCFAIPDSVTQIETDAFLYAVNLASVTMPDDLTTIAPKAFACAGLAEVEIPDSVTAIGESAFADCANLKSATLGNGLTVINSCTFSGAGLTSAVIPDSVTVVGKQAFFGCADLESVAFGKNTTVIGESAFLDCANLLTVTFGSSVESIGKKAFSGTALTTVVIPEKVREIAASTFADCENLTSVHVPSSVISISESALADCDMLSFLCCDTADCCARTFAAANNIGFRLCTGHENAAATVSGSCGAEGDNVLWALNLGSGRMIFSGLGDMADYADSADTPWADYLFSIQTVSIQSGVTSIADNAFYGCVPLSDVTIGEDVTRIGARAFASAALTSIAIPRSVTQIGKDALACGRAAEDGFVPTLQRIDVDPDSGTFFSRNGVLFNRARTELLVYPAAAANAAYEIPDTVKRVGDGAFKDSRNLARVHVPYSVTEIGENAFDGCDALEYLCCDIAGSFTETYAADNAIPFRFCDGHKIQPGIAGDANGDGRIDLKDAILIRRYLAGGWDNVVIYGRFADVDADNAVTLQDVALISRYLAGGWGVVLR